MKLSPMTLAMRQAFAAAKSPERFLFNELPQALGVEPLAAEGLDRANLDTFFASVNRSLQEWSRATPNMIDSARDTLLQACGLPPRTEGWQKLRETAQRLEPGVTNPTLLPFIRRAMQSANDQAGIESVIAVVANRPPQTWADGDVDRFPGAARAIGASYQAALRDHDIAQEPPELLTPAERQKAEQLAKQLERFFRRSDGMPPQSVIRAAIALLGERVGLKVPKG